MLSYQETKAAFLDRPLYCVGGGIIAGVIGFFISVLLGFGLMVFLAANSAKRNPSGINDGPFYLGLGFVLFVGPLLAIIGFIVGLFGTVFWVVKKEKAYAEHSNLYLC